MRKWLLAGLAAYGFAWAGETKADDCNPDFGEKTLAWVRNDVARQSRELARTDYISRNFNYRLVGYERLHRKLGQIEADLDAVANRLRTLDQSSRTDVALAVEQEQVSEHLLTRLYELAASIEVAKQQHIEMTMPTDRSSFRSEGYTAVGRETLIASVRELGESSAKSLGGRYGFYVQVTFDDNGTPQSGHVETTAGSAVGIGSTLVSTGNPYAMLAGTLLIVGGIVINEVCREHWDDQITMLRDAAELLPAKLITEDEQWEAFNEAERVSIASFADHGNEVAVTLAALHERWRTLFAANASRAAAADAVLTAAKVSQIRNEFDAGGDLADIREQVAITEVARGISQLNGALALGRISIITSCLDAYGLAAEEQQHDAIRFVRAQLDTFRTQGAFAPLHPLIDRSDDLAQQAAHELATRGPSVVRRDCRTASPTEARRVAEALELVDLPSVPAEITQDGARMSILRRPPESASGPASLHALNEVALRETAFNGGFCAVVRHGDIYDCGHSRGSGPFYEGGFADSGQPRGDIFRGANDGGFARDSRRMSREVEAVSANIEVRIEDTRRRTANAQSVASKWATTNSTALKETTERITQKTSNDIEAEVEFRAASEDLLTAITQEMDNFVASKADPSAVVSLIRAAGIADMSLPEIARIDLPPSMPEIIGVNALEMAFGAETSQVQRQAMREGWKAEEDLSGDLTALRLSSQIVSEVERVGLRDGGSLNRVARELLLDSASLRFQTTGQIAEAEIAIVGPDGTIMRRPLSSIRDLPPNTLIEFVRDFHLDQEYYRAASASLRNELTSGAPYAGRREAVLDVADGLFVRAQASFNLGHLAEARAWLSMAVGVLDVATRFLPGIDWGRDIYEAVTGRDLFTGATLSSLDRVSAIIGALSAGVANNGLQVFRAFAKLDDLPADKVDEIYEFAQVADGSSLRSLKLTDHALARMDERLISMEDVRKALDDHNPFWHRENRTYVAVSNDLFGDSRVGVAVNVAERRITTVMHMSKSDADILGEIITKGPNKGRRRYEKIRLGE